MFSTLTSLTLKALCITHARERERERERERAMETTQSWAQPLHSTVASSELRDIYEVYNKEVRKLGFKPKTQCL